MKYHVRELIDLVELQTLMDGFYLATGINHALLDLAGTVLTAAGWQKCCTDFHRVHPKSCQRCHISDQYILRHLQDGPYVAYECLNGLFEYATPVIVGGEHVATIFTGQLLHQAPDLERFTKQAKEFSFDEADYLAAIKQVNIVPRERMSDVMCFLVRLAESLGKSGLARLKQLEANAELETVVASRTAELVKMINILKEEVQAREEAEKALHRSKMVLQKLAANRVRVKEDERKRIAREIHDELGQTILVLRIDVSMLLARTGITHPKLYQRCSAALHYIDSTLKSVRNIINNLRPPVLDLGLRAAIEWQIKEFQLRSGIPCKLTMDKENPGLNEENTTAVFRILQESLTNIQRHARASHVEIELTVRGDLFLIKIIDDGIGIHPDCRIKANAFGLLGMRERVSIMGGELRIDSRKNGGTALTILIPRAESIVESPQV
jgi:signal transduction histidine kinase